MQSLYYTNVCEGLQYGKTSSCAEQRQLTYGFIYTCLAHLFACSDDRNLFMLCRYKVVFKTELEQNKKLIYGENNQV